MKEIVRPDIRAIYDHYGLRVVGRGNGAWLKAQCPMPNHEDENPSASINEELGKWGCFSCDKRGDGLDIVMERENIARLADAQRWCQANIDGSVGPVLPAPGPGGALLGKSRHQRESRAFVPAWRRL